MIRNQTWDADLGRTQDLKKKKYKERKEEVNNMKIYLKVGWDGTQLIGNLKEIDCSRIKDVQKQKKVS